MTDITKFLCNYIIDKKYPNINILNKESKCIKKIEEYISNPDKKDKVVMIIWMLLSELYTKNNSEYLKSLNISNSFLEILNQEIKKKLEDIDIAKIYNYIIGNDSPSWNDAYDDAMYLNSKYDKFMKVFPKKDILTTQTSIPSNITDIENKKCNTNITASKGNYTVFYIQNITSDFNDTCKVNKYLTNKQNILSLLKLLNNKITMEDYIIFQNNIYVKKNKKISDLYQLQFDRLFNFYENNIINYKYNIYPDISPSNPDNLAYYLNKLSSNSTRNKKKQSTNSTRNKKK